MTKLPQNPGQNSEDKRALVKVSVTVYVSVLARHLFSYCFQPKQMTLPPLRDMYSPSEVQLRSEEKGRSQFWALPQKSHGGISYLDSSPTACRCPISRPSCRGGGVEWMSGQRLKKWEIKFKGLGNFLDFTVIVCVILISSINIVAAIK